MLQMPEVPVKYAGQQTAYLLHHRSVKPIHRPKKICLHIENLKYETAYTNYEAEPKIQLANNCLQRAYLPPPQRRLHSLQPHNNHHRIPQSQQPFRGQREASVPVHGHGSQHRHDCIRAADNGAHEQEANSPC